MDEENEIYEVTVFAQGDEQIKFERTTTMFVVAATQIEIKDDGRRVHNVFMMSDNLTPQVTTNICLALLQRDLQAKEAFVQAFENLQRKEREGNE